MKDLILIVLFLSASTVTRANPSADVYRQTLSCGEAGCAVTCYQPGDRWQSFLQTAGDIELTYFLTTGVRQLKAPMADGSFTVLDTHLTYQSCKITGVVARAQTDEPVRHQ